MMNLQRWLLLDYTDDLPEKLYRLGGNPDPHPLFNTTELAAYAEQSPLLIGAEENPAIAVAFNEQPNAWPGLLIDSAQPLPGLLQHLRHILFIGFDGPRKGVLRYFSPRTASYFFPVCSAAELSMWLGPIHKLSWHAATWRECAEQGARWYSQDNPHAAQWQAAKERNPLQLGNDHAAALQHQQTEKFLFHWWQRQSRLSFAEAFVYLEEGMASDFLSADSLHAYLDLRAAHRNTMAPATLPQGHDEYRLAYLKTSLERSSTDKESQV